MNWYEIKDWLEQFTGLDRDSLHIYGTVGLQLLFVFILRRPLASIWPWLLAFGVVLLNEYADISRFDSWQAVPETFRNGIKFDLWNSMVLPTILMVTARFFPNQLIFPPDKTDKRAKTASQEPQLESEFS